MTSLLRLVWHQWFSIGLVALLALKAATVNPPAALFGLGCLLAVTWGFCQANAADDARADAERAYQWSRRDREAQR